MESMVLWERDVTLGLLSTWVGIEWLTQKKLCSMEMGSMSSESPLGVDQAMWKKM